MYLNHSSDLRLEWGIDRGTQSGSRLQALCPVLHSWRFYLLETDWANFLKMSMNRRLNLPNMLILCIAITPEFLDLTSASKVIPLLNGLSNPGSTITLLMPVKPCAVDGLVWEDCHWIIYKKSNLQLTGEVITHCLPPPHVMQECKRKSCSKLVGYSSD